MKKIIIYTDGGCSPNPGLGGWGAILLLTGHNIHKKEISGSEHHSTNNRMELTAAIKALEALKYSCIVDLHTDSKYLQNAFNKNWITTWIENSWQTSACKDVANRDLWEKLIELSKVHSINWHWVKGHANNHYNIRCDELVKKARDKGKMLKKNNLPSK